MDDWQQCPYFRWALIIDCDMAFLKAISYYLPDKLVSNPELEKTFGEESNTLKAMGVESRAWASENETAGDMAVSAAKKLFAENNITPASIDFVIFCSQCMDYFLPSTSCLIQTRLGIPTTVGAFGMDLGCSGYVYGLAVANSLVESGTAANVLLLTADTLTKYIHPQDKNLMLFGDAASASVVSNSGFAKIGKFDFGTDGSGAESIIVRNGSSRHFDKNGNIWTDEAGNTHRDDNFFMDGEAVFNFTVERTPSLIDNCLRKNNLDKEEVGYFVFHQANKYMLNTLRKLNQIPKEKFFVDLSDTGNTSSSTVPIGVVKSMKNDMIKEGMKVMLAGFGVGFSWASTILFF